MNLPEEKERLAYTVTELAKLTGYSARSWWRIIRNGAIPTIHMKSKILVPADAVKEFLRKRLDRTGAPVREAPPHIRRKVEKAARAAGQEVGDE